MKRVTNETTIAACRRYYDRDDDGARSLWLLSEILPAYPYLLANYLFLRFL